MALNWPLDFHLCDYFLTKRPLRFNSFLAWALPHMLSNKNPCSLSPLFYIFARYRLWHAAAWAFACVLEGGDGGADTPQLLPAGQHEYCQAPLFMKKSILYMHGHSYLLYFKMDKHCLWRSFGRTSIENKECALYFIFSTVNMQGLESSLPIDWRRNW